MSHTWKGDIPAARDQYNSWIKAMMACRGDISRLRYARLRENGRRFCPLLKGIHWPSLPFGDEGVGGANSFDTDSAPTPGHLIDSYAARISDTPRAREAIGTILESAFQGNMPETLSADLVAAYNTLNGETRLAESGVGAAPGADREPFDAEQIYQDSSAIAGDSPVSSGGLRSTGLLAPLQQLSFWKIQPAYENPVGFSERPGPFDGSQLRLHRDVRRCRRCPGKSCRTDHRSSSLNLPKGTGLSRADFRGRQVGFAEGRNSHQIQLVVNIGGRLQVAQRGP
jgi:hypothetical protein